MTARTSSDRAIGAWREVLTGLSTLAWAGARNSTRGGQLHRDGWVGRVRLDADSADAVVGDGDHGETVQLRRGDRSLESACSCGVARCAHAVAVAVQLQRQARQAAADQGDREGVLAALRERLRPAGDAATHPPRALRDLERLPAEAAVDMVSLAWRQALRPTANDVAELALAVDRVAGVVVTDPKRAATWGLRLLDALGATRPVFTPLPEAACAQVERLCHLLQGCVDGDAVGPLFRHATDGAPQIAPPVAALLGRWCVRAADVAETVHASLLGWAQSQRNRPWREHAEPGGVDLLVSACVDAARLSGHLDRALALALAWPPGRSALLTLLADRDPAVGRMATALLSRFDPRGATFREAAEVAYAHAESGAAALALWALDRTTDSRWYARARSASAAGDWSATRDRWVAATLVHDDPPWLAAALAQESDAADALFRAVLAGPLREATADAAIEKLAVQDPDRAVAACQARLLALCAMADPSHKTLIVHADRLCQLAARAGLTGAAGAYLQLVAENANTRAPLQRLFAAFVARSP